MPFRRAPGGMLRTHIRPARAAAPARSTQIRWNQVKDNLGGPGGQQPPPPNPGGPEALRRNWMAIAGGALALVGGYAYISRNPEEARQQGEKTMGELSGRKKTDMAGFRHE